MQQIQFCTDLTSPEPARSEVKLSQLAELMGHSHWQFNRSAAIKRKIGYRLSKFIFGFMSVVCCGNLYSYIDSKSLWLTGERMDANNPAGTNSDRRPIARLEHSDSLDEMNERAFGRKRKFTPAILASRLLLAIGLASELSLFTSAYFKYRHDYYQFHLIRFNTSRLFSPNRTVWPENMHISGPGLSYERVLAIEQELRRKEQEAREPVETVGCFLMQYPYLSETAYLFSLFLSSCIYLAPMVYFYRKGSLDFCYFRLLFDWDQEQRNCNRLVEYAIKQFASSSKNFSLISRGQRTWCNLGFRHMSELRQALKQDECGLQFRQSNKDTRRMSHRKASISNRKSLANIPETPGPRVQFKEIVSVIMKQQSCFDEQGWTIGKLKHFALTDQLQPFDLSNVDELSSRIFNTAAIAMFVLGSVTIWDAILYAHVLPVQFGFSYELGRMDLATLFGVLFLNTLASISATFYLAVLHLHCYAQAVLVAKLRSAIAKFVMISRRLLQDNDSCPMASIGSGECVRECNANHYEPYEWLNSHLLLILLHYRILVARRKPGKQVLGFVIICCVGSLICLPIISRLHSPYLHHKGIRIICTSFSLVMIACGDIAIVPVCWLNSRCSDLCKSLWSLMATVVAIAEHPKFGRLLNEHSIWLLRKELSFPDRLKSQITIAALGCELSYAELLKLHFWLGLAILSLIYDIAMSISSKLSDFSDRQEMEARQSMFGRLSTDPLGVISSFTIPTNEVDD